MNHVTKCTQNNCFKNKYQQKNPDGTEVSGYWLPSPHYKYKDKAMVFSGVTHEQSLSNPCYGSKYIKYVEIIIDVNGKHGPSVMGKDVFYFKLYNYTKKCPWSVGDGEYYDKYPYNQVLQICKNGDYSTCGLAIQMNDWKNRKDIL